MTIVAIALTIALAGAMGVIVWLVKRGDSRVDQVLVKSDELNTARKEITDKTLIAERALFEKKKAVDELMHEEARSDALEDFISVNAQETDPNADLAPDDMFGRVLRFSQKTKRPRALPDADQGVPAGTGPVLHPEEVPGSTGTP